MVDPLTVAAGAGGRVAGTLAGKVIASQSGRVRFAGREERRQAYDQYVAAALDVLSEVEKLRTFSAPRRWALRRLQPDRFQRSMGQMNRALGELLLLTNPVPGRAAQALANSLLHAVTRFWRDGVDDREAFGDVRQQITAFTAAARYDLLYVPRVWQIWRPAWWSLRFASGRAKRAHLKLIKEVERETKRDSRSLVRDVGSSAFSSLGMAIAVDWMGPHGSR